LTEPLLHLRILIAEDEYLLFGQLQHLVESAGHEVIGMAPSASRALAICADQLPDVALIDLHLRDGFTGLELAVELAPKGVMVWFVTANTPECQTHRHFALGCVPKPFREEHLVGALELTVVYKQGKPLPETDPEGPIVYRIAEVA
jgi:two-component system, response regulator PdtaR